MSPPPSQRPWILRAALACTVMAFVLFLVVSKADRIVPVAGRAVSASEETPSNRASARVVSTTRTAWQRGGGRRTPRSASSQVSGPWRPTGLLAWSMREQSSGASIVKRTHRFRRDLRLASAPTRAPPTDR